MNVGCAYVIHPQDIRAETVSIERLSIFA
uniref:Uncharacterized protein n=1 Tax=Anguilla anguilla TaxID=7936 RepID=A0A0E9TLN4_ANGAN